MDDLVTWLRVQLDNDESATRELLFWAQRTILTLKDPRLLGRYIPGWHDWPAVERMRTDRLAEIDAKRRIVEQCQITLGRYRRPLPAPGPAGEYALAELTVMMLALPYADRPGYRQEWAP